MTNESYQVLILEISLFRSEDHCSYSSIPCTGVHRSPQRGEGAVQGQKHVFRPKPFDLGGLHPSNKVLKLRSSGASGVGCLPDEEPAKLAEGSGQAMGRGGWFPRTDRVPSVPSQAISTCCPTAAGGSAGAESRITSSSSTRTGPISRPTSFLFLSAAVT